MSLVDALSERPQVRLSLGYQHPRHLRLADDHFGAVDDRLLPFGSRL